MEASKTGNGPDPGDNEYIPTRSSLLSRLRNIEDDRSWYEFFETYWKLIYRTAMKAGLSDSDAQEVVQETMVTLARNIPEFRYDPAKGSFKGWLLQTTRWRILNQVAKRKRQEARDAGSIEDQADPTTALVDSIWDEEWERNLLDVAMARVKRKANPKHFQAFELYTLREWPVGKVADSLMISVPQVYLAKHRVSGMLKTEVQRLRRDGC